MLQVNGGDKCFQKLPSFSKSCFICAGRQKLLGGLSLITTSFFTREERGAVHECWCDPEQCVCPRQGWLCCRCSWSTAGSSEQVSHLHRAQGLLALGQCQLSPVGSQPVGNVLVHSAKRSYKYDHTNMITQTLPGCFGRAELCVQSSTGELGWEPQRCFLGQENLQGGRSCCLVLSAGICTISTLPVCCPYFLIFYLQNGVRGSL